MMELITCLLRLIWPKIQWVSIDARVGLVFRSMWMINKVISAYLCAVFYQPRSKNANVGSSAVQIGTTAALVGSDKLLLEDSGSLTQNSYRIFLDFGIYVKAIGSI